MNEPIAFAPEELSVIQDTRFFHIKSAVTPKVQQILHRLRESYLEELSPDRLLLPDGTDIQKGQFVKGEYLLDFPYLYLDFPKLFTKKEKFAFRTLFWWGHYWVFSWILEGRFIDTYKKNIIAAYDRLSGQGLFLLLTDTPWEWRREEEFVLELRRDNHEEVAKVLETRSFLKIHRYMDFGDSGFVKGDFTKKAVDIFRLMRVIVSK